MILPLAAAFAAALFYGISGVLKQMGARRTRSSTRLDPALLVRVMRQPPYLAGIVLDVSGSAASLYAVRRLPLFAVQSVVASGIGVTALAAWLILDNRPGRLERVALALLGAGLVMLGVSAAPGSARELPLAGRTLLVLSVVPIGLIAAVSARSHTGHRSALRLGALSGLAFGGAAVGIRSMEVPSEAWRLVANPVVWAVAAYAVLGMLLFTTALQRGSVTSASAALMVFETVVPSLVGLVVLGDHARPGFGAVAAAGFAVVLVGALTLSRTGKRPDERHDP
ncbi:MAG: hypothetical protein WDA71_03685 [Actinomycetota bacterium]